MNTKDELLEKLIVMSDVEYISKQNNDSIMLRLSQGCNYINDETFIAILTGYTWATVFLDSEIDNQHFTYIKITMPL